MTNYTFRHIKKYLETADVTEFGFHDLDRGSDYPKQIIHIYSSKSECNIINKQSDDITSEVIMGKLYFRDDDEVCMIRVRNGIADFDNPIVVSINEDIQNSNSIIGAFRPYGRAIQRILKVMAERIEAKEQFAKLK
jgi:hypothetical protein